MRLRRCAVLFVVLAVAACSGRSRSRDEEGELLYVTHCRRCHGMDGRGGRYAARMSTPPANLASLESSEEEVRRAITEGVPGTNMPPHAIDEPQLDALVGYVLGLRAQPVP